MKSERLDVMVLAIFLLLILEAGGCGKGGAERVQLAAQGEVDPSACQRLY